MAFPVRCHPVTESGPIQPELTRDLSNIAGCLHHHLGGFLLELRREITTFLPCHSIPSFPPKILLDPRPESSGHSTLPVISLPVVRRYRSARYGVAPWARWVHG